MNDSPAPDSEAAEARDAPLLQAAIGVFARYGFRKASMDEVARAAGVSRQCLYLHFATKEDLFRRAVGYKLTVQLRAARDALADERRNLSQRLIAACEEWSGRYVGLLGADAADLMCASTSLAGSTLSQYENAFEEALEQFIAGTSLRAACAAAGYAPRELARAMHATARGLKQLAQSRQEFQRGIAAAVELLCRPVSPGPEADRPGSESSGQ